VQACRGPRRLTLHSSTPTTPNGVDFNGKFVTVGAFPIGIDPEKFVEGLKKPSVQARIAALTRKFEGVKLIVGVDRLDYIKGVPQKLHALEVFLTEHPEWIGKIVLVQVAVPSRQDVEEYQNLRAVVNELVGRINGKFGTIEFMPIHFLHQSVSFDELTALYAVSDVCLVSSTRDGMNLVSYEYIATQRERHGVMILSEFTGAAQSLNGSLIVNPWNTEDMANAIHDAVTMSAEQREANFKKLERYVFKYTSAWWGQSFVAELTRISAQAEAEGSSTQAGSDKKTMPLRALGDKATEAAHAAKDAAQSVLEKVEGSTGEEKKE
jgi:trehalose 6-phosphate synthase